MAKEVIFILLLLGTTIYGLSLPSRCRFFKADKKIQCKLARLYRTIKFLEIPSDVQKVLLPNNEINNVNQVMRKIEGVTSLKQLDLSYNDIDSDIRNLIAKNKGIENFSIRNNKLRSIHERTFENNPSLERVDLSNNMISVLPRKLFIYNPKLQTALLWANDLKILPEDLFRNNKEIEVINLSWNKLEDIPETFFRGLTKLKKVMLWKNQLTCLYSSMFKDNGQLNTFHVAINYIKKVPDNIFDTTPDLEDVRFWSNKLECIPRETFKNNEKIGYVNLLLGNDKLPYQLKQRFSKNGGYSVNKMTYTLFNYGNMSCTAAPCEWNPETLTMDCSYRGLTSLESLNDVCEKVRNLNLDGNKLNDAAMLATTMQALPEVRSLSAKDNDMGGELNPETLKSNLQLTTIDLSGNKLGSVPGKLFEANSILKSVNFAQNEIEKIPEELLFQNPEMAQFDMSQNRITELSKSVFSNSRLMTDVKLSKNRIRVIDEETFKNNEKLRAVDLADNRIEGPMFLSAFENAPDLETIQLRGNQISKVKKGEDKKQKRMATLELSYNKLDEFPVDMIQTRPSLKKLIVDHNKIEVIPPEALHSNPELVEINLSFNRLTKLRIDTFSKNSKLEILNLDNNALTTLDAGLLEGNPSLKFFSANGNKIHFVAPTLFFYNILLEEVRLSDNIISNFPEELFVGAAENLRFVTMSKNNLDYLPRNSFDLNSNLESVCLYGNTLSRLAKPKIPEAGSLVAGTGSTNNPGQAKNDDIQILLEVSESYVDNYIGTDMVKRLKQRMKGEDDDESDDEEKEENERKKSSSPKMNLKN